MPDVVIETKPARGTGSLRIAIGQIFDYRRYLERHGASDTAILTITRPENNYVDLLSDLGITAVWFTAERIEWSTILSKTLKEGPTFQLQYVFIAPESAGTARKMVEQFRGKVLTKEARHESRNAKSQTSCGAVRVCRRTQGPR